MVRLIQIQHLLKLNYLWNLKWIIIMLIQIQHLLKLNSWCCKCFCYGCSIQIQHLLKLNCCNITQISICSSNSNTTFVKVKFLIIFVMDNINLIQIQHLLKLNARKINLYDFIVLLKVLINKDFSYFLSAIMRFEGI